eukprot:GFUD01047412.1.p1 GENE.GFUD01047412.1~~GFUD01047412.1.p1  ORF type:complete len:807 (+),score=257.80 GFUD01047412.1:121-2541(+)
MNSAYARCSARQRCGRNRRTSRGRTVATSSSRMSGTKTIWECNSPDSLLDLSARFCITHLDTFLTSSKAEVDTLHLPTEIGEKLFQMAQEEGVDLDDKFIHIFRHLTRICRASLRESSITDRGIKYLLRHGLRELDIHNCAGLTVQTLHNINRYSDNLQNLCVGNSVQILPDYLQPEGTFSDSESEDGRDGNIYEKQGFIIKAPKLKRLCVRDLFVNRGPMFFDLLLKPLTDLNHLDLSGAFHNQGMGSFGWLLNVSQLVSLTLHNVQDVEDSLKTLCQLKNLHHVDISQCNESRGHFKQPTQFMETLVRSLPKLRSLDISGTNLAGTGGERTNTESVQCDIAGLASRVDNPLEFLGLYKTHNEASGRQHIPARSISGDSCEAQILVAGQRYLDRPTVLENILNDLFHVFRYETCQNLKQALDILLLAMERHNHEKHIQISGSASLYYVVKSESLKRDWNVKVKRKILGTLLNGMLTHREDPTMMRNGCLTLCQFQIPADVLFDYKRLVKILLHIVSEHTSEENNFIQRAGIFLLNSLACQVDGQQKMLVGSLGAMEKMLLIITDKLQQGVCDDVMETAWSTMWNVTDETPVNCERFLNGGGMYLFLKCKDRFPDKADLLRNMMGLLGNVAEVPSLRHKLMTKEFVEEFAFLLDSCSDGIEVSYNAAGVLAHMASDGPQAWAVDQPDRDHVLFRMARAINRWDLRSGRNINYRSFSPIIRLAGVSHTPECQLWAIWALANLTTVTPEKYCKLVVQEGGLSLVEEMLNENSDQVKTSLHQVKEWAGIVRSNVLKWEEQGDLNLEFDG